MMVVRLFVGGRIYARTRTLSICLHRGASGNQRVEIDQRQLLTAGQMIGLLQCYRRIQTIAQRYDVWQSFDKDRLNRVA